MMLDMEKVDFSGRKYAVAGPSASGGMVSLEAIELLTRKTRLRTGRRLATRRSRHQLHRRRGRRHGQSRRRIISRQLAHRLRRRTQLRAQARGIRIQRHRTGVHRLHRLSKNRGPGKAAPRFQSHRSRPLPPGRGPDRIGVVDFDGASFDRTQTVTLENLQAVLRRVSQTDVTLTSLEGVASTYTDRARQGNHLPQRPRPARRRRRPHPFAARWSGTQHRSRRRHESGLETRRNHLRLGAPGLL